MGYKIDKSLILKSIKLHYGIKKDVDFANFLGIPPSTLASWFNRGTFDYELLYSKCNDIDANWLLSGKGDMLKSSSSSNSVVYEPSETYGLRTDNNISIQQIPLYSLEVSAGIVQLFRDHYPTKEYISIPNLPKCDGALYVNGDSMYPLLKSGDIVMYRQINDIINCIFLWGEMYLISFEADGDNYSAVKYIQKSDQKEHIRLVSQNKHHDDLDIPRSSIRALALVKASIRINAMN